MAKPADILGLNARQKLYKSLNADKAVDIANSKLMTKEILEQAQVSVPKLYGLFETMEEVKGFDFETIETSFVIKPSSGSAGKGILIIKKKLPEKESWLDVDGEHLSRQDLELHISDILEGQYSTYGTRHQAFVEERVPRHPKFKRYVYSGTPDIRVLVFNKVPVMAMLRLPTKESEGRANLHQGAIGVGIDVGTGVTLKGVQHGNRVRYVPETRRKLNGLKIPLWSSILRTAVAAAEATGLMFCGVDILLHNDKGPMVVELNASPGLGIQIANDAGLKWRLERVEGLRVRNVDHGVRVGKALFAESFADKVKADEGITIVGAQEEVALLDSEKKRHELTAVIDTGLYRTQIDKDLAAKLGLLGEEHELWERTLKKGRQRVVEIVFYIRGRKTVSAASVVSRSQNKIKLVVGRLDLQGFLVNPEVVK